MGRESVDREASESLLAARAELGPAMEPALVDSFANKIVAEVQRQTAEERRMQWSREVQERTPSGNGPRLALGITSLALSIPLTAMSMAYSYPWMAVVCWIGIVLVNVAFAMRRPGPPDRPDRR